MENLVEYLEGKWSTLTAFSKKEEVQKTIWKELLKSYTQPNRYYHNLIHIGELFLLLDKYIEHIKNPAVMGFSIFYHDHIYDTLRQDNEEKSAATAKDHLRQLNFKKDLAKEVEGFIIATKAHQVASSFSLNNDIEWFLDFDLAVLGSPWDEYELYSRNIRKEFKQYTDEVYNLGRKNALVQLLNNRSLYITSEFQNLYDAQARENISREIALL